LVAGGAAGIVLVAAGFWVARSIHNPFELNPGRRHLSEIAVSPAACPSVESIHSAANQLQLVYTSASAGFDVHLGTSPWPELQSELEQAAGSLDSTIERGLPVFPRPLRHQLSAVRVALAVGRRRLATVTVQQQLDNTTGGLFASGQEHFGYASDLVGNQCSVPLQADDDSTFLALVTRTTASPPTDQLPNASVDP
jgi:hypothetical protein